MQIIHETGFNLFAINGILIFHESAYGSHTCYQWDSYQVVEISETEYAKLRYQSSYQKVASIYQQRSKQYGYDIGFPDNCMTESGRQLTIDYYDDVIRVFTIDGQLEQEISPRCDAADMGYYSIAATDNLIWLAEPAGYAIHCIDYEGNQVYKIGGDNIEMKLDYPEFITIYQDKLYICETQAKRILTSSLAKPELAPAYEFGENVWEIVFLENEVIVRLDSGVYKI